MVWAPFRIEQIRAAFFSYGWLTPVLLPLAQIGGRALFDILAYGYIAWSIVGLYGLYDKAVVLDRALVILYVVLLSSFLLGVPGAEDAALAFKMWLKFSLRSLILVITLVILQHDSANVERLQNAFGVLGLLTLLVLYIFLIYYLQLPAFTPIQQLKEDNLPFLLPFMLVWVWRKMGSPWCYPASAILIIAVFAYIVVSEGRAALLALVVMLMSFGWFVLNWRLRWIGLATSVALGLAVLANPAPFNRSVDENPGWTYAIDAFTTGRTVLWRQALEHPPNRLLLGVGMGNGQFAEEVLTIGDQRVRHLHNFVMDAWYETGFLGLTALLLLISYVFVKLVLVWRFLLPDERRQAGVFVSAVLAVVSAACFSFSYDSRQFAIYLFLFLAVLAYFSSDPRRRAC